MRKPIIVLFATSIITTLLVIGILFFKNNLSPKQPVSKQPNPEDQAASQVKEIKIGDLPSPPCGDEIIKATIETGDFLTVGKGWLFHHPEKSKTIDQQISSANSVLVDFALAPDRKKIFWIVGQRIHYQTSKGSGDDSFQGSYVCERNLETGKTQVVISPKFDNDKLYGLVAADAANTAFVRSIDISPQGQIAWIRNGVWLKKSGENYSEKVAYDVDYDPSGGVINIRHYYLVRWAPDGQKLLMVAGGWEWTLAEIYDTTTGKITLLDNSGCAEYQNSTWSKNSRYLYWATNNRFGCPGVGMTDVINNRVTRMKAFDDSYYNIDSVAFSDNGKVAAVLSLFGGEMSTQSGALGKGKLVSVDPVLYLTKNNSLVPIKNFDKKSPNSLQYDPTGTMLSYLLDGDLYVVDVSGKEIDKIESVKDYSWVK